METFQQRSLHSYQESFEAENFRGFCTLFQARGNSFIWNFKMALFIYEFKRKYEGFRESFLRRSACTTCRETFLPWNFYGIRYFNPCHRHQRAVVVCQCQLYKHIASKVNYYSTTHSCVVLIYLQVFSKYMMYKSTELGKLLYKCNIYIAYCLKYLIYYSYILKWYY